METQIKTFDEHLTRFKENVIDSRAAKYLAPMALAASALACSHGEVLTNFITSGDPVYSGARGLIAGTLMSVELFGTGPLKKFLFEKANCSFCILPIIIPIMTTGIALTSDEFSRLMLIPPMMLAPFAAAIVAFRRYAHY